MRPQQLINIGAAAGDGTGDPARTAFDKVNDNFTELYEQTTAIDKTFLTSATLVALCHDWDGRITPYDGWRDRCSHTSWENETLSGNWLGSAANEAAARAISGATTGSYYYDTTAAGFYALNAGSGKTLTYRGNARKYPADRLITVEAGRAIIWDLTQAGVPMWAVLSGSGFTSVAALDGVVLVGRSNFGLLEIKLVEDRTAIDHAAAGGSRWRGTVATRNALVNIGTVLAADVIANTVVNDVAITVLPNAPVDVATGLPIPTIVVGTAGGISVIKDDGTIANLTTYMGSDIRNLSIHQGEIYFAPYAPSASQKIWHWPLKGVSTKNFSVGDHYYASGTIPSTGDAYLGTRSVSCKNKIALADRHAASTTKGLFLLHNNPASPAAGMVANITKDYSSGWLVGDIRGAWLADTVAETLTGTELVTGGTFDTDVSGWSNFGTGTISWDAAGKARIDNAGTVWGGSGRSITTVVGKTYTARLGFDKSTGGVGNCQLSVGNALGNSALGLDFNNSTTTGVLVVTFTATATTTYLTFQLGTTSAWLYFDDVSCRRGDPDRSFKVKGLQVFGSLTKSAVASGAALMGYGGFSTANYLHQPYNAHMDFGTGDFCIMGWVKEAPNSVSEYVFARGDYNGSVWTGAAIRLFINSVGTLTCSITDDGFTTADTITLTFVDDSIWRQILLVRRGSNLELWANGVKAATDVVITAAAGAMNNTTAETFIGVVAGQNPLTNGTLALWRAGATAPTAEQIKHIYETERPRFEAGAQDCLAGTSNAVTALAYDDETDLLHVGTSYGRSAFKGLVRVASEATGVGAITALSAGAGIVAQAGATAVDVYVPAYLLREELLRDAEQMAKFGQNLIAHDFTATASQTTFTLPVGWEIVAVYQQGSLKRETTSWARSFDGFRWSVVLGTGATVSDWVSILAKRV